jgi:hypothetical protein
VPTDDAYSLARRLLTLVAGNDHVARLMVRVVEELAPCRHAPDFASVVWHGKHYSFTAAQAAVVRILWRAWRHGTPEVRQETLSEAINSDRSRMANVFRDHPAWGALIIPGAARGTFRLHEPEGGQ